MQGLTIRAYSASTLEDVDTFVVGLYDDPATPVQGLELQRALAFDDQDVALGMDTYCVVSSDGPTHYGGVASCVLQGGQLHLRFQPEAARVFGVAGYVCQLDLPPDAIAALTAGLQDVFTGARDAPDLRLG